MLVTLPGRGQQIGPVDVRNSIARAVLACLRVFLAAVLPAKGTRRKTLSEPVNAPVSPAETTMTLRALKLPRSPYAAYNADPKPLRGEDTPLVRPYFAAFEDERERVRAERRRAAELATYGIDVGPDVIHGIRLPA